MRSGTPKIYIKTAESGNKRAHAFCPGCGTPIYAAASGANPTSRVRHADLCGGLGRQPDVPGPARGRITL